MNSDQLQHLLQQADAAPASEMPSTALLASSIRKLSRRRRQRTLLVGAGIAVVVTVATLWQAPRMSQVARDNGPSRQETGPIKILPRESLPTIPSTAEKIQASLAAIEREQQMVTRLLTAERRDRAVAQSGTLQVPLGLPAADVEQLDRAASALVVAAERKEQRPQLLLAAREDYNLILLLFPNTPWADLAQDRLMNPAPHHTP